MRTRVALIAVASCLSIATCGGGDDGADDTTPAESDVSTDPTTAATTTEAPTTTAAATTTTEPIVVEGATVVVANSSIVGGAAGRMSAELTAAGFTTGTPTNGLDRIEESIVYFTEDAGAEDVADSVAVVLGGVEVDAMPDPIPTETGTLDDAQVLVLLGNEQADQTLDELSGGSEVEPVETAGSTVVVANDSGVNGAAGAMTDELKDAGFTMGAPTNGVEPRADSIVYYTDADGAEDDATLLAETLGDVDVEAMPDPIPTESGELDGEVLLLLGTNQAGKSLDDLNP
jgi:flavodoxin